MSNFSRKKQKWLLRLTLGVIATCFCVVSHTPLSRANTPFFSAIVHYPTQIVQAEVNQEQEAQALYDAGRFAQAAKVLEQVVEEYQNQGNQLKQAVSLSNLSLSYQKLGLWQQANQAITQSLSLLKDENSQHLLKVKAHTLNRRGSLQFAQGKAEKALDSWQQAAHVYGQAGDEMGVIRSRINQAQALQVLGFYRRAWKQLTEIKANLVTQPDSLNRAVSLRSLGNVLQLIGDLDQSRASLEESLAIARTVQSPQHIAAALLDLGNIARLQQQVPQAQEFYQQAFIASPNPTTKIKSQINQLSLLVETKNYQSAQALVPQILSQLEDLTPSRNAIYARINLTTNLLKMQTQSKKETINHQFPITEYLATAVQQARTLQDQRAEAYALGTLGSIYEQTGQWEFAQNLTEQALILSQTINATDITYLWQWQLGRLLKAQGDNIGAIAAYQNAIDLLKSLRSDLVAINTDVQFSFRETVEPVYRELVSLLLQEDSSKSDPAKLEQARKVIESLQLAQLDNFFRSACLKSNPVQLEQIDTSAAVIYPIILPDRLEVIVSIPQQPLRHYATRLTQQEVEITLRKLRQALTNRIRLEYLPHAQKIYQWLLQPAEEVLAQSGVKTLVFVLDGSLRNIPMAVLHDGQQYLVQKYRTAVTPGLELLEPKALEREELKVLSAGISEARQEFAELPGVAVELKRINSVINGSVLLNQDFTKTKVQNLIDANSFPIVHLATHGRFSSKAEETFILTWEDDINVNELGNLLQTSELGTSKPIELLVLSACETATGDNRAALGIAGIAVRAGARSTMASLWLVDDQATAIFMAKFYQELAQPETTKAEALRRAQIAILQDPDYRQHPYYWAPFILVGNWL